MDSNTWAELGQELYTCLTTQTPTTPLTGRFPELTVTDAYQIQLATLALRLADGRQVVGKKIGLTSKAMQNMLGVHEPDFGHLTDDMAYNNGDAIPTGILLQPKVEGEIAFLLKKDLQGPGVTVLDVLDATAYVLGAIEIVDSRVADWKIKLPDTVADNASSGVYVLGDRLVPVHEVDLRLLGMVLEKNGALVNTGVGAAALGNPAACVAWLANKMAEFGVALKAGEVVLSGALSAAVDARPGDHFRAEFASLGSITVSFAPLKEGE